MAFLRTGINNAPLHEPDTREMKISNGVYSMQKPSEPDTNDTAAQLARELAARHLHIDPDALDEWR